MKLDAGQNIPIPSYQSPAPNTWLEIDLGAIRQNVGFLKGLTRPGTKFLAVVKANAYGHGLVPVARAAAAAGAEWLGVNSADEALILRHAGITAPILVLGVTSRESLADLASARISVVASSREWLASAQAQLKKLPKPLAVHLKLETGTHRLGGTGREAIRLAHGLRMTDHVIWQGTYSHLAAVEERHEAFTRRQAASFTAELERLIAAGGQPGIRHLAASAATMLYPELNFDMVRCGIGIYGLWPSKEVRTFFENQKPKIKNQNDNVKSKSDFLKPVLAWKTKIVQIKRVVEGTIGYGRTFRIKKPMTIAVLPIGYAEGYDRHLSNKGEVLVDGTRCPVVGRVAMNMTAIDITSIAEVKNQKPKTKINVDVILIGRQDKEEITVDELAEKIGTINYEVVARLPVSLPRIFGHSNDIHRGESR